MGDLCDGGWDGQCVRCYVLRVGWLLDGFRARGSGL